MHPWYLDATGARGSFDDFKVHMRDLLVRVPPWGYFQEPTNIILVISTRNVHQSEEHFRGIGVQVVTGIRYLGSFICDQDSQKARLSEKVTGWTDLVGVLDGVACRNLQTAYDSLKKSLHKEWDFI